MKKQHKASLSYGATRYCRTANLIGLPRRTNAGNCRDASSTIPSPILKSQLPPDELQDNGTFRMPLMIALPGNATMFWSARLQKSCASSGNKRRASSLRKSMFYSIFGCCPALLLQLSEPSCRFPLHKYRESRQTKQGACNLAQLGSDVSSLSTTNKHPSCSTGLRSSSYAHCEAVHSRGSSPA